MIQLNLAVNDSVRSLSEPMRSSVENSVADVIYESFVLPADEDYITARLLATNGLQRSFFWSASQATEKYLKAYLVAHGESILISKKRSTHSSVKLFDQAVKIDPSISDIDIQPHSSLRQYEFIPGPRIINARSFLEVVDQYGSPDIRYNASGTTYIYLQLYALDSFVKFFRARLETIPIGENLERCGAKLKSAFFIDNPHFAGLKQATFDQNQSTRIGSIWANNVPRAQFLKKNRNHGMCQHALTWLEQRMVV